MTHDPVDEAVELASSGRIGEAVARLQLAGDAGDARALMQLAVWHLGGTVMARDFDVARTLLRRAVTIGHVDGALMEVALTANGNGNTCAPDWNAALALLDAATANDSVAAAQRDLLNRMALRSDGSPLQLPTPYIISEHPRIVRYSALLTQQECIHVASVASELLEPSFVLDPRTGKTIPHPIRTSDGGAIGPAREDLVIRALNLRIAAITDTKVEQGEPLTVLRYQVGQQYRPHLDTIAGAANQRIKTALIYLNQGFGGGQTSFPGLGLTIEPRAGDAIVFETTLADGSPDTGSLHAGEPVTAGSKWLATRWIRKRPVDSWTSN